MDRLKDLEGFFENFGRRPTVKKTQKYDGEIVRINRTAAIALLRIIATTNLSKRVLVSYGIFLLNKEFEKWANGDHSSEFGCAIEVLNEKSR